MITKNNELSTKVNENVQGGSGSVVMAKLASAKDMYNEVRLFSKLTLKPGCGIGEHTHTGECEVIYILKGNPTYCDNGEIVTLAAGDVTYCPEGEIHWIRNDSNEDVEIIALIVVEK